MIHIVDIGRYSVQPVQRLSVKTAIMGLPQSTAEGSGTKRVVSLVHHGARGGRSWTSEIPINDRKFHGWAANEVILNTTLPLCACTETVPLDCEEVIIT